MMLAATKTKNETAGGEVEVLSDRRATRWDVRERVRDLDIQCLERVAACGNPIGSGVALRKGSEGGSLGGLATCGSVHSCPVCAPVIRQARANHLADTMKRWQADGGHCFLVTLTLSHNAEHTFDETIDALQRSWRLFSSGRRRERLDELGSLELGDGSSGRRIGIARSIDVTHREAAGWHPHYHCVFFTRGGRMSPEVMWKLADARIRRQWADAVVSAGRECDDLALDVKYIGPGEADSAAVAMYTQKAAWEVCRIDLKSGGKGRSPWELLALALEGDVRGLVLWREYSRTMHGRHATQWSQSMRAWAALDDQATDDAIAAGETSDSAVLGVVSNRDYVRKIRMRPGRVGALLVAIELDSWPQLLAAWGVGWEPSPQFVDAGG